MSTDPARHRIAKLLARAGVASRREVERMIEEGRVAKDGVVLDTPATLLASLHGVTVDGEEVAAPAPARLFLFHKPTGVLTSERDPLGRVTIYDRLPKDLPRVVPVGRLDLNTEGLLLLTTDGALKRQLELPATGVERAYRARAYGPVTQAQLEELIEGIEIEGIRYGSIDANLERRTGANVWIEMVLAEGKNREVRRVLEHLGLSVSRLIRTRYGPFVLGDLPPGAVGEVRAADLAAFRQSLRGARALDPVSVITPGAVRPTRRTPDQRTRPPHREQAPPARRTDAPQRVERPHAAKAPARSGPVAPAPHTAGRSAPRPRLAQRDERPATAKAPPRARPAEPAPDNAERSARPARPPQRKAGWARPKPKAGPKRPRK